MYLVFFSKKSLEECMKKQMAKHDGHNDDDDDDCEKL